MPGPGGATRIRLKNGKLIAARLCPDTLPYGDPGTSAALEVASGF